MRDSKC